MDEREKVEREYRKAWKKLTGFEFIDSADTFTESADDNMKFIEYMKGDADKLHSKLKNDLSELEGDG